MANFKVSRELKKATEALHSTQLAQQELTKKFISTPKDAVKEREKIKAQLIALSKKVKEAEDRFNNALSNEDIDDDEDF